MLEHKPLTLADIRSALATTLQKQAEQLDTCNDPECEVCRANVDFFRGCFVGAGYTPEEVEEHKLLPWRLRRRENIK